MRNFRNKLFEAEEPGPAPDIKKLKSYKPEELNSTSKTLGKIIKKDYPNFIKDLTGVQPPTNGQLPVDIDDKVRALLGYGLKDGNKEDEKITITKSDLPVKNLKPTQSQIGLLDSIGFPMFVIPEKCKNALGGAAEFKGERILTANGKYILDGHHRWSQIFILNPDATIPCLDIKLGEETYTEILKVIQLAIAKTFGKILMKSANAATDIFNNGILTKWNKEYNISGNTTLGLLTAIKDLKFGLPKTKGEYQASKDNVMPFLNIVYDTKIRRPQSQSQSQSENEKTGRVLKYLAANADLLKTKHKYEGDDAPERSIMPQPGDTADDVMGKNNWEVEDGIPKDFIDTLRSGELNYKPNFLPGDREAADQVVKRDPELKESKKWVKTFEQFRNK